MRVFCITVYIAKEKGVLGDFYDQRLEVIDFYHDLSRRIARMRLLGTAHWTKEDYELAFAIKAGYIRIPSGPLYMPNSYVFGTADAEIKRGLFNVRRWVGPVSAHGLRSDQDPFPNLPIAPNGLRFKKKTTDPAGADIDSFATGANNDALMSRITEWPRTT